MYLNVGICDDEEALSKITKEKLIAYSAQNHVDMNIHLYQSGDQLLDNYPGNLDVLFLDMMMQGRNGLETAAEIRKTDKDLLIVFLSAYTEYVFDCFSVNAFRYLLKPINQQRFCEAMDAAVEKVNNPDEMLTIQFKGEISRIHYDDIICIRIMNRKIWIYCEDRTYRWIGNMSNLTAQLHDKGFFRVNRSYLINLNKVVHFNNATVEMEQGYELKISRARSQLFKAEYMKIWNLRRTATS